MSGENFRSAFRTFMSQFPSDIAKYAGGQVPQSMPVFPSDFVISLFRQVGQHFSAEATVLEVTPPCIVVGDLHGQVLDLVRILTRYGDPGGWRYVFLGDLVDRGEFSVETLVLVFLLKAIWPTDVFVIRGNHEFASLCSQHGFLSQVLSVYTFSVFQAATDAFAHLPLAAKIGKALCVHGGIGPAIENIAAIREIPRPADDFTEAAIAELVWSDPSDDVSMYEPSETRGAGCVFGESAVTQFLTASNLEVLVRAHECVLDGYRWQFAKRVLTVFSASNYTGTVGNNAAVAEVTESGGIVTHQFPPLPYLPRAAVALKSTQVHVELPKIASVKPVYPTVNRSTSLRKITADTAKLTAGSMRGRKLTS
jgi:protein phosphatase